MQPKRGMGYGTIDWPKDENKRIGALIGLFRSFTSSDRAAFEFSSSYVSSEGNYNDNLNDLNDQIFDPFVRDLRRYITSQLGARREDFSLPDIPAADRIVTPDHNSTEYTEAITAVEKAIKAVKDTNNYADADDQEQRIAELEAGTLLLKSPRFRLQALNEVLLKCLTYLAKQFVNALIGILAADHRQILSFHPPK